MANQSNQGMRWFLKHFTADPERHDMLRDRELCRAIRREDWATHVYPGMVIEMVSDERRNFDLMPEGPSSQAPSHNSPTTTCHLCGFKCYNERALGKHAKDHIRPLSCPGPCMTCNALPEESTT